MKEALLQEDLDIMIDLKEANEKRTCSFGINVMKNALQYLIGVMVKWLRPCQVEI